MHQKEVGGKVEGPVTTVVGAVSAEQLGLYLKEGNPGVIGVVCWGIFFFFFCLHTRHVEVPEQGIKLAPRQ